MKKYILFLSVFFVFNLSFSIQEYWSYGVDDSFIYEPVIVKDYIIYADFSGNIYSFSKLGELVFKKNFGGEILNGPTYHSGLIYFISGKKLYGISYDTGDIKFEFDMNENSNYKTLSIDNYLVAINFSGNAFVFMNNDTNGYVSFKINGDILSEMTALNDTLFVGFLKNKIAAYNLTTGSLLWENTNLNANLSLPVADENGVYIGLSTSNLVCINGLNGEVKWNIKLNDRIISRPTMDEDNVYAVDYNGRFYSISKKDGNLNWYYDTYDNFKEKLFYLNGVIYGKSESGVLYGISSKEGGFSFVHNFGGDFIYPVIYENFLLTAIGKNVVSYYLKEDTNNLVAENIEEIASEDVVIVSDYITNYINVYITNYVYRDLWITNYVDSKTGKIYSSKGSHSEKKKAGDKGDIKYTIQVGAFISFENAKRLYDRLLKSGYNVYMMQTEKNKKRFYRVRIGHYASLEEVKVIINKLKNMGLSIYVVKL